MNAPHPTSTGTPARVAGDPVTGADGDALADSLRLLSFATAERRVDYLRVLRVFDAARANYVVLLHAGEIAATLAAHAREGDDVLDTARIAPLLDQLTDWGVLDRTYDGTRAATLAEYRNRHYVYQLTGAGYRALHAVEQVLADDGADVALSRLALADLDVDLRDLATANAAGDGERVHRTLRRLDATLTDMAERAARFYLVLGDLVRTDDVSAETFLVRKDAVLAHMRDFGTELARRAPRLARAVAEVRATGVDDLVRRAAEYDERVMVPYDDRLADWRARWIGVEHWFEGVEGRRSEVERMREATMSGIAGVLALLRRVTESRRSGVSRESQLRHLAAWFAATPSDAAAHALFTATFDLSRPRHFGSACPDEEAVSERTSWWDAPAVELARTLAETGRAPAAGAPGRIVRNDAGARRLREAQLERQRRRAEAEAALASGGVADRELTGAETDVLLALLDVALGARVPVSGTVAPTTGSSGPVTLTLAPSARSTVVRTARGRLHLQNLEVTVR